MANENGKSLTKNEMYSAIAETSGLTRGQVKDVFDGLTELLKRELGKKGPGIMAVNGLMKIKTVHKPAVKGGGEKPNPFKPGEMMKVKDRPAKNVIRCLPLKALKDMVA